VRIQTLITQINQQTLNMYIVCLFTFTESTSSVIACSSIRRDAPHSNDTW